MHLHLHLHLSLADQTLAHHLGLGFLHDLSLLVCHGYQTGCRCLECVEREMMPAPAITVCFPWEQAA